MEPRNQLTYDQANDTFQIEGRPLAWLVAAAKQKRPRLAEGPQVSGGLASELVHLVTMSEDTDITAEHTEHGFRFSDSAVRFLLDALEREIAGAEAFLPATPPYRLDSAESLAEDVVARLKSLSRAEWDRVVWHSWLCLTRDLLLEKGAGSDAATS